MGRSNKMSEETRDRKDESNPDGNSGEEGLVVIGAGLSRTGTLSTRMALQHLLGAPCYHGSVPVVEQIEHLQPWVDTFEAGKLDPETAKRLLNGCKGGVDWPVFCWYKELMEIFPNAKVLLTVRDPRAWFHSQKFMADSIQGMVAAVPYSWFFSLIGAGKFAENMRKTSMLQHGITGKLNRALLAGEDASVKFYEEHVEEVKANVPPEKLLVFSVKEGWQPLCTFLDLPVPSIPFPNINDRKAVQRLSLVLKVIIWIVLVGIPLLLACKMLGAEDWFGVVAPPILAFAIIRSAGTLCTIILKNHTDNSKMH